jgi:adenylate kinase
VTREDDTEEALAVRLRDYHEKTDPVIELFRRKEYVFTVDARSAPEAVQEQIRKCLGLPPMTARKPRGGSGESSPPGLAESRQPGAAGA